MGLKETLERSLADIVRDVQPKVHKRWKSGESGLPTQLAVELMQYSDVRYAPGGDLAGEEGERLYDEDHLYKLLVVVSDENNPGKVDDNPYHFTYTQWRDPLISRSKNIRDLYWRQELGNRAKMPF